MPAMTRCPGCKSQLRVPDNLYGQQVKCPVCDTQFVALSEEEPNADPVPVPPFEHEPEEHQDYEERPRRVRRRNYEPHRGGLILALGIVGLVACAPVAIPAWILGESDLKKIRAGIMDPEGEGLTQAGRILGIIGTIFCLIGCVCGGLYGLLLFVSLAAAPN